MAKKNRKNKNADANLPEGMSRRQAKLAARAAERAALERDPRPYDGFAAESDLIALQEFVPSASFTAETAPDAGFTRPVTICTVLPGAAAALVRAEEEGGEALVALQTQHRGDNPHRDLAFALNWAKTAEPGSTLEVAVSDGSEPALPTCWPSTRPRITVSGTSTGGSPRPAENPQVAASSQANDPSAERAGRRHHRCGLVDRPGRGPSAGASGTGRSCCQPWRVHAAGDLNLARAPASPECSAPTASGAFFDLDNTMAAAEFVAPLKELGPSSLPPQSGRGLGRIGKLTAEQKSARRSSPAKSRSAGRRAADSVPPLVAWLIPHSLEVLPTPSVTAAVGSKAPNFTTVDADLKDVNGMPCPVSA